MYGFLRYPIFGLFAEFQEMARAHMGLDRFLIVVEFIQEEDGRICRVAAHIEEFAAGLFVEGGDCVLLYGRFKLFYELRFDMELDNQGFEHDVVRIGMDFVGLCLHGMSDPLQNACACKFVYAYSIGRGVIADIRTGCSSSACQNRAENRHYMPTRAGLNT